MGEPPRPSFRGAVVGALPERDSAPEASRAGERLVTFLDRATVRVREFHHLTLTTFTHGPGTPWAKRRGHSIILIPRFGRTATAERELVEWCDAVVVVGNPAPWARLVRAVHVCETLSSRPSSFNPVRVSSLLDRACSRSTVTSNDTSNFSSEEPAKRVSTLV